MKVIGRLPGEKSCLSLVWAVLDRASSGWRGVKMTPMTVRRLQKLRRELLGEPEDHEKEVIDEAEAPIDVKRVFGLASGRRIQPPHRMINRSFLQSAFYTAHGTRPSTRRWA